MLKRPLQRAHVKPRLVGHWGTTPGLNFIYAHLNRVIKARDLNMVYVIGPGHGGPALVAHAYFEGTYSEVYPHIGQDGEGMKRLGAGAAAARRARAAPTRRRTTFEPRREGEWNESEEDRGGPGPRANEAR